MRKPLSLLLALLAALSPAQAANVGKSLNVPASIPSSVRVPALDVKVPGLNANAALPNTALPSLALPAIPALPAAAAAAPQLQQQPAVFSTPLGQVPAAGEALRQVAERLADAKGEQAKADLGDKLFDGRKSGAGASDDASDGWSPRLPPGVKRATVHEVNTAADVERLIPDGPNSRELIEQLKRAVPRMAPYRVYKYHDAFGRSFTAIDISQKPDLIDHFPEQQSHEIALIKKIQLWNKDLQIVVREDGKTPDLVVGGMMTELKSLIGRNVDFTFLVNKANRQITEHAQRHGLGHGSAAIDLTAEQTVPVGQILADLEKWRRATPAVSLDKIFVFAGLELKVFVRQTDGSYRLQEPPQMPLSAPGPRRPADPKDVRAVQLLLKKGRIGDAERRLRGLEENPQGQPHHPVAQARRNVEGERLLGRLSKLMAGSNLHKAFEAWDAFVKAHGDEARELEPRVREILPFVEPKKREVASAQDESQKWLRELEEPEKLLDKGGVEATITAYGSARLQPGSKYYDEARKFGALVAKYGRGKIAMVTGGGPGIMEAANRGAFEAGGPSIGYNIKLPHEQSANPWLTPGLSFEFEYFATRKIHLRGRRSMGLVYFPGGFGTLDELFEVLTLMQTGKMPRTPIVLLGEREHWNELIDFDHLVRQKLISSADLKLFTFVETAEQAWAALARGAAASAK